MWMESVFYMDAEGPSPAHGERQWKGLANDKRAAYTGCYSTDKKVDRSWINCAAWHCMALLRQFVDL